MITQLSEVVLESVDQGHLQGINWPDSYQAPGTVGHTYPDPALLPSSLTSERQSLNLKNRGTLIGDNMPGT